LKPLYSQALAHPDVVGLVIGTRPDCIDEKKLDFFSSLAGKHYLVIEYGIESTRNKTLELINRGHTYQESVEAIRKTAALGIRTGAHLIFGLPGETRSEMLSQVDEISSLPLTTIKFHQLQIVRNTLMAKQFQENPEQFNLFTLDEYLDFIVRFVEKLNPGIVIERFSGEVPPGFLISKPWAELRADQVALKIEHEMEARDTWQGKYYQKDINSK